MDHDHFQFLKEKKARPFSKIRCEDENYDLRTPKDFKERSMRIAGTEKCEWPRQEILLAIHEL